jgi:hypothetical protein
MVILFIERYTGTVDFRLFPAFSACLKKVAAILILTFLTLVFNLYYTILFKIALRWVK